MRVIDGVSLPIVSRRMYLKTIIKIVTCEMVNAIKFDVPIVVDSNYGNNWYEAH